MSELNYDVALSFAGEDREYVEKVAALLIEKQIRVHYDKYERATLWGKDLYTHLSEVYYKLSRYTIMFVSEHYSQKVWTNHERKAAQARAFKESIEYILPARFDDTEVPGLLPTIGYIDLRETTEEEFVDIILEKIGFSHQSIETSMSVLSNKELQTLAIEVVDGIRVILAEYWQQDKILLYSRRISSRNLTDEERDQLWHEEILASTLLSTRFMFDFSHKYKTKAIIYRDELVKRLPTGNSVNFIYEHPTNPLGVETVADDLQKLALQLMV